MTPLDILAAGKYLSLTTFRADGTAVATPVWLARDGEALVVITAADSGKAKRLRRSSRTLVAPCDVRGTTRGEPVEAVAELQDAAETTRIAGMIRDRYGLLGRLLMWRSDRAAKKSGRSTQVGIRITLP